MSHSIDPPPAADTGALAYQGSPIRRRGAMLHLTDMWREAGSPENRRPADWLALGETARFRAHAAEHWAEPGGDAAAPNAGHAGIHAPNASEPDGDGLVAAANGKHGGTWAHWQLTLAYARYRMRQRCPALRCRWVEADVAGMADDPDTAVELVSGGYEIRKSSARRGAGSGVEVRVRAVRRRNWSTEDKLRIVRETLAPGAVAKAVAERHGIGTGLLFTWRREMLATAMSGLVPVEVVPEPPRLEPPPPAPAAPEAPGTIEVGFPSGATVRVSGQVDEAVLRAVLAELGGR